MDNDAALISKDPNKEQAFYKRIMNVEGKIPYTNLNVRIFDLLTSYLITIVVICFLLTMYQITSHDLELKELLKFQEETIPWSLFTSLFVHNSENHLQGNSLGLLIFLPIFLYHMGIFKGLLWLILFGIGGHILEILIFLPLNVLLYFYISVIKLQDLSNIPFGFWSIIPPSGVGISGSLCGIMGYLLVIYLFRIKAVIKNSGSEKNKLLDSLGLLFNLNTLFTLYLSLLLFERSFADIRFLFYIIHGLFKFLPPDLFIILINSISNLINASITNGNPFLAHLLGMIMGILGYFWIMRN